MFRWVPQGREKYVKRTLPLVIIALCLTPSGLWAQYHKAELTPFIGYQFGGGVSLVNGDLKLDADMDYGLILDYTVRPGGQVELSYTRSDTRLKFQPFVGTTESIPATVHYFQIGGLGYATKGRAQPFASFTLGATYFQPKEDRLGSISVSDEWRFSMKLGLGVKTFMNERFGLRLAGHLYGTFLDSGGGFWCGGGSGCGLGLFGTGILQADVQAGAVIAF
jgi:hypothetical protein